MRVLLVSEQYRTSRSGVGTYARGLFTGLAAAGHDVTLAVCRAETPDDADFPVVPMDTEPGNLTALNARRRGRALRAAILPCAGDHDLVHFLDARWAGPLGKHLASIRTVGTVHDTYALDWQDYGSLRRRYADRAARSFHYAWLRRREAAGYRRLTRLLANSNFVADALRDRYRIPPDRVEVVRLGLAEPEKVETVSLEGDPAVLFVGANFTRKGLSELIEAVATTVNGAPGIRLHVVGSDGRADRFRRLAERRGVGDAVMFHGPQPPDRVLGMMVGAGIYAMPSHSESWGLVYLEAMRAGTPVIATARGGLSESVENGRDVILVEPGEVAALAQALARLTSEESIGAAGRVAAARFSAERTVAETVAAYERAV